MTFNIKHVIPLKVFLHEARVELTHNPLLGWKGAFGAQVTAASLNASEIGSGSYAIGPPPQKRIPMLYFG
uniref:Uncharacterized protein n=1 Tax=Polynucleobacter necessarius subsp. necessarius (strain STIR1) TaxID=452638 RepID=B1XUN1_POLNS